jgi:hypothetical protein
MAENALVNAWTERRSEQRESSDQYHSAEFAFDGLEAHYQFKIWNTASTSMCVLIKETSEILPRLKVGDTLKVKYYRSDSRYPSDFLGTVIRHITKNDQGRFKGHYLVGLEILKG